MAQTNTHFPLPPTSIGDLPTANTLAVDRPLPLNSAQRTGILSRRAVSATPHSAAGTAVELVERRRRVDRMKMCATVSTKWCCHWMGKGGWGEERVRMVVRRRLVRSHTHTRLCLCPPQPTLPPRVSQENGLGVGVWWWCLNEMWNCCPSCPLRTPNTDLKGQRPA